MARQVRYGVWRHTIYPARTYRGQPIDAVDAKALREDVHGKRDPSRRDANGENVASRRPWVLVGQDPWWHRDPENGRWRVRDSSEIVRHVGEERDEQGEREGVLQRLTKRTP
jgi:hypothetical protein